MFYQLFWQCPIIDKISAKLSLNPAVANLTEPLNSVLNVLKSPKSLEPAVRVV